MFFKKLFEQEFLFLGFYITPIGFCIIDFFLQLLDGKGCVEEDPFESLSAQFDSSVNYSKFFF